MEVFIEKQDKQIVLDKSCTALELLKELDINPAEVLIVKNNEVVLEDEPLSETDKIRILSVVSGG